MQNKQHVTLESFVFCQEALDKRVANAEFSFLRGYSAVDRMSAPASILMPQLETLFKEGRSLSEHHKTDSTFTLTVYLQKTNIADLLAEVAKETEAAYRAELEVEKEKNKLLLAEQYYQDKKRKEQKVIDAKEQKDRDAALAEAEEYFANLSSSKEA